MSTSLLRTKLHVPKLRPTLVARPRLTDKLSAGVDRKLTLISAPAGFGKSTLLSQWAADSRRPVAWLSLDEGDNHPLRFWTYVIAALQTILAGFGEAVSPTFLTNGSQESQVEEMLIGLINDVADTATDPFALVLDDYHVITAPQVNDACAFLVDSLPPQMHLILSGRSDPPWPLARLRARGEMTELRTRDLRFTPEETAAFLKDVMGLALSADDISAIEARTEGWIAGLQMAALSMQGREDISGFIGTLSGSHRFILDYLVEEVLDRQPPAAREFLLTTSILNRMSASLCDAVTGGSGSQEILAQLEQANLFLVALDDQRRWYRYHHLFGDLLRNQLMQGPPDRLAALHRRASQWYEHNGSLAEAMSHASAAGDTEQQVRLIAGNVLTMAYLGELATLVTWLDALPDDVGSNQPWFCVSRAWVLAFAGRLDEVEQHLHSAEQALQHDRYHGQGAELRGEGDHIAGHIAAIRGYVAGLQGDVNRPMAQAREALRLLPQQDTMARGWTTLLLAVILRGQGELAAANQAFAEAAAISRGAGHIPLAVDVLWERSILQMTQGQLHAAMGTSREVLRLTAGYTERSGRHLPPTGYTHAGIAQVLYEWNDLEQALVHATEGVRLCRRWGMADALIRSHLPLAMIHQALGNEREALEALQEAKRIADSMLSPMYQFFVDYYTARIHLTQGDIASASQWADRQGLDVNDEVIFQQFPVYVVLARLLIAQDSRRAGVDLRNAAGLLKRLQQMSESAGSIDDLIELLVLRAITSQAQGNEAEALNLLERALYLGEPGGYVRTFIDEGAPMRVLLDKLAARGVATDYVSALVRALGDEAARSVAARESDAQPLLEPLSDRELDVLRLLPTGLSSTEIAEELFVAPSTVRTHIKNIYGKLDAHSRVEAVQRAKELSLL